MEESVPNGSFSIKYRINETPFCLSTIRNIINTNRDDNFTKHTHHFGIFIHGLAIG